MIFRILLTSLLCCLASAETVHRWNFTTGWVTANPDGLQERQVIGWNGEWPLPLLEATIGDRIELALTNGFDDLNTTLHFHGMFLEGNNQMDGPEMVVQCPIAPGETMLYNFTLNQTGAYWYHSHTKDQLIDGMRGAFIIHEKEGDFPYNFDEEVTLTVSDWYHDPAAELRESFLSRYNPTGAEPIVKTILFNETHSAQWKVQPGKTYLLNLINSGAFVSQYVYMEDHSFTVVAVDGVYVKPNVTDMLYITVAQRYTVLVETKNATSRNYAFMQKQDDTMLDVPEDTLWLNATSYIVYDDSNAMPDEYTVDSLDFLDDFYLSPLDEQEIMDDPDYTITVDVLMDNLGNGVNYAFFNNISYVAPKIPTLVTAMTSGDDATNPSIYGNVNAFVLDKDEVVEIVLNNNDTGTHPFHLHGHVFQVVERGPDMSDSAEPVNFNPQDHAEVPSIPMKRDTLYVRPQSYFRIRFKADNPGIWYFHCHIEWHLLQGLAMVMIEDPLAIQEKQSFTDNYLDMCDKSGVKTSGNAAGNSEDFLDMRGENVQVKPLPDGFTARGIVALVFSFVAGILGCAAIGYYGMADIPDVEERTARGLGLNELTEEIHDEEEEEDLGETSRLNSSEHMRE